jgi:beta-glucosidase
MYLPASATALPHAGSPSRAWATTPANGHDRVEAQVPVRELQDTFVPSYSAGVEGGAGTVMIDSGSVDGIPATASHFLITEELRGRLGFHGVVISDFGDVPALATKYHLAPDLAGAVALAVNAGLDMAMLPFNAGQLQAAILQDVGKCARSKQVWRLQRLNAS